MLEPLDRFSRDSTLFQFTSRRLRDFIDPKHLLIQIDEEFDFQKLVEPLEDYYCRDNGRPAIHPEVLVRALLISALYRERRRLALAGPLGGGELPAQLFDRRRQTRNLILLSADQGDQLPVLTGWRVSVRTHSRSIRICPADRNASAEAANQLRLSFGVALLFRIKTTCSMCSCQYPQSSAYHEKN